ncbi:MAG: LD-carboxypeptidase [Bacteroidota bacterium]
MNRRNFQKRMASLAIGLPLAPKVVPNRPSIKPVRLRKGDVVGVIAPGSPVSEKALERANKNLEGLGLVVKLGKNIRAKRGFNAGTDEQRLEDLHAMFADTDVAAIWCARGGYGCTRLLPSIDYNLIRTNPKALIGYSDITALLQAIHIETGLIGFHAAVASSDFTRYTKRYLKRILFQTKAETVIEMAKPNQRKGKRDTAYEARTIREGYARGKLVGGNLSLLAALAGTKWELQAQNKVVFLEDIGEKPYRIDRMLTQLRQASYLKFSAGIALGIFEDCEAEKDDLSLSLQDTLDDRLTNLGVPVAYGLSFGHIADQCVLPIGITVELDATSQQLILKESAVV